MFIPFLEMRRIKLFMKIRMEFRKNMKYISHLDLMKSMQKTLKRSQLKLKYSEGFNPHIILSIANPLPLGVIGGREFADFEILDTDLSEDTMLSKLVEASPPDIIPKKLYVGCEKSFNLTEFAVYDINITTTDSERITELLRGSELLVEKKTKGKIKQINLIELIHEIKFSRVIDGILINLICACGNTKNLNPMLIKKALTLNGVHIDDFSAERSNLLDADFKEFLI